MKDFKPKTIRGQVLETAKALTEGDRNKQYGSPYENHAMIAKLWSVRFNRTFTASEVAIAMMDVKTSRITIDDTHQDSFVDLSAYGAIAYECGQWQKYYESLKRIQDLMDDETLTGDKLEELDRISEWVVDFEVDNGLALARNSEYLSGKHSIVLGTDLPWLKTENCKEKTSV